MSHAGGIHWSVGRGGVYHNVALNPHDRSGRSDNALTPIDDSPLPLAQLRARAIRTFRQGGGSRPDVLLVERESGPAVLKDHAGCDPWFGRLIGPVLAAREARALRRLEGVAGVPRLLARPSVRALLMEYCRATPITRFEGDADWALFFARLETLLRDVHRRGVAHCDLRSPTNTLITPEQEPVVVDFVACVFRGSSWNFVSRWIFEQFRRADLAALAKLKRHVAPELVTEAERASEAQRGWLERAARRIGSSARVLSRWLFTKHTG